MIQVGADVKEHFNPIVTETPRKSLEDDQFNQFKLQEPVHGIFIRKEDLEAQAELSYLEVNLIYLSYLIRLPRDENMLMHK